MLSVNVTVHFNRKKVFTDFNKLAVHKMKKTIYSYHVLWSSLISKFNDHLKSIRSGVFNTNNN